jgi:hypothetical protein
VSFKKHYGCQSLMHSSPYFCKYFVCVCVRAITVHFVTCEMLNVRVTSVVLTAKLHWWRDLVA